MLSLRQEDPGFSYNKNIIGLGQVVKRPSDEGRPLLLSIVPFDSKLYELNKRFFVPRLRERVEDL